ncbi:hypothetical protein HMPREF1624_00755 [Sporothrix schenckii ATCC 58251]|uniref:Oxidoreductase n=1 Tax=Sporothrix schenckii (strain ATCC 58251 / de Perez 2211183) TaxID=1391915 RepID=U7Q6W4_SPOS1|nr:hypothetical protein HMPREF1624_00755 [Sporothrix schenckii ATCC 58251]
MATHAEYGASTTATEVAAAFADQIKGKNVVVTGISPASIGYTTVLAIASQAPAHLVLASRTQAKLDAVVKDVRAVHPSVPLHTVLLDLASVESVRAAAQAVAGLVDHVDVLINNAGISTPERLASTAPDGTPVDGQFLTNHLGVFLWTSLLLPSMRAAPSSATSPARIINLTSQGHHLSPVRFSDYAFTAGTYNVPADEKPRDGLPPFFLREIDGYPGFLGYGQSKTANILHATELARRCRRRGDAVTALSVHPGTIETELSRSLDPEGQATIAKTAPAGLWKTQDQGAATTLVAAFDPALARVAVGDAGQPIGYLSDCQLRDDMVAAHAKGAETATRLWTATEAMLQHTVDL